ncbi:MAG: lysylphosphatidylglycerol synthase domain-containing protein [Acidimicrobiia bacterium]
MIERAGYILTSDNDTRVRRARDAVRIGAGVLILVFSASSAVRLSSLQDAIGGVLEALPGWAEAIFWVGYGAAGIYAVTMVVIVVARARQNPGLARDVVLSFVVALVMAVVAMRWSEGVWPRFAPEFGGEDPEQLFPMVRVAVVTAVVLALSPHVTLLLRRFGSGMVLMVALSGFGLEFGFPSDALGAVAIGMIASGSVLLIFGSPGGYPEVAVVSAALRQLGIGVAELEFATDQSWGTRRLRGVDEKGNPIEVKAYGRDAADTQLAAKVWRGLWYRDAGPALAYTRMQAVEHEALMAMFAERAGVPSVEPLTAGMAGDDVAILAVRRPGSPLIDLPADEITDELLVALWGNIAALHQADMSHSALTAESVLVTSEGPVLDDFAMASLAAGDRRQVDVVSLLFSVSQLVGLERAAATAGVGLGEDRLAAALPFFQLPAISRAGRRQVAKPKALMSDLRQAVADLTGVEPPEAVKLRRASVGSILMTVLIVVAANALFTQLAGIDYEAVWAVIEDASWLGLLFAYPVAHLMFIPEASGMMAAVGMPLPMRPLVILQLAARFIGLAVPSAAGRVAMNSAFLVKFGVSRTVAVIQGAVDGISGFVVEAGILALALVFTEINFDLGRGTDWGAIFTVVLGIAVAGGLLVFLIQPLRRIVLPVLKEALGTVAGIMKEPRRAITLVTSNFLARLALGFTLWIILRAIGVDDVSIPLALTVTVATNLLAGLVPIPGGVGIAEAVMTSWLVVVGVPEAPAFAATVMFRMWTFYLPAVEGFFAMRWLEQRDYL